MLEYIKIAEDIYPGSSEIHNAKGIALSKLDDHKEALTEFLKAAKIDYYDAEIHKNIGVAYTRLGRLDDALRAFKKAVRINPKHKEAKEYIDKVKILIEETE